MEHGLSQLAAKDVSEPQLASSGKHLGEFKWPRELQMEALALRAAGRTQQNGTLRRREDLDAEHGMLVEDAAVRKSVPAGFLAFSASFSRPSSSLTLERTRQTRCTGAGYCATTGSAVRNVIPSTIDCAKSIRSNGSL